jgi:hypothetical protein
MLGVPPGWTYIDLAGNGRGDQRGAVFLQAGNGRFYLGDHAANSRRLAVKKRCDSALLFNGREGKRKIDSMTDIELFLCRTVLHDLDLVTSRLRVEQIRKPLRAEARVASDDHHRCTVRPIKCRLDNRRNAWVSDSNYD